MFHEVKVNTLQMNGKVDILSRKIETISKIEILEHKRDYE